MDQKWSKLGELALFHVYILYILYIYIYILYILYIIHIYICAYTYITVYIYTYIYMYYIYIIIMYIYIPGLRKDTHNCPFARFPPLGRISCEGPGNCHFLTTVVKFAFRTFWADLTLLCINKFFLGRNSREKGGNTLADSTWLKLKTWSGQFFSWNSHFILTWTFSFFMIEIEPKSAGQKFVANE